jgi:hypothetical protein
MSEIQATLLEQARDAARRGEWQQAYDFITEAEAAAPLESPDLALLADVAYAAGRLDVTIRSWERAHARSIEEGDHLAAAGAALRLAIHLLCDTSMMAPVRGWIRRAERLLEGYDETPVHAWLSVARSYDRLLSGDFTLARQWARDAIDVGARCEPAAAAIGRVAEARSLILDGDVPRGLELLNEAAVATVSGELDPLITGIVYCELVCAMQALGQYDLAEQWTEAMEHWRYGNAVGGIHGRCRVHRAEILRLRGYCPEAEQEAVRACEELRPYLRREMGWPLTELGRIRLNQGDLPGAEAAFLAAHEAGWCPQPGLALVYLARGDVSLAATLVRDALDNPRIIPSKEYPPNSDLRRAPLLEALVEIEIAADNLDAAQGAAEELSHIAARFGSQALAAGAALARGRVDLAEGHPASARRLLEEAAYLWTQVGAPYETAVARMELAHAYRAEGDDQRAALEFRAAQSSFERIGARHRAADAARACGPGERGEASQAQGQSPTGPATGSSTAGENVFRREGDYWVLACQGRAVHIRDRKGLRYLARLLAEPGREFHVLDLVDMEMGWASNALPGPEPGLDLYPERDAGAWLDAEAKEAYRSRLAEIEEDIEDARAMGDEERAAHAEADREWLVRELARAVGLGGRDRRAGSTSERARASVTRAIRQAMTRIREHHPTLGSHLDRTIRTGTYCVYFPGPRVPTVWKL